MPTNSSSFGFQLNGRSGDGSKSTIEVDTVQSEQPEQPGNGWLRSTVAGVQGYAFKCVDGTVTAEDLTSTWHYQAGKWRKFSGGWGTGFAFSRPAVIDIKDAFIFDRTAMAIVGALIMTTAYALITSVTPADYVLSNSKNGAAEGVFVVGMFVSGTASLTGISVGMWQAMTVSRHRLSRFFESCVLTCGSKVADLIPVQGVLLSVMSMVPAVVAAVYLLFGPLYFQICIGLAGFFALALLYGQTGMTKADMYFNDEIDTKDNIQILQHKNDANPKEVLHFIPLYHQQ